MWLLVDVVLAVTVCSFVVETANNAARLADASLSSLHDELVRQARLLHSFTVVAATALLYLIARARLTSRRKASGVAATRSRLTGSSAAPAPAGPPARG